MTDGGEQLPAKRPADSPPAAQRDALKRSADQDFGSLVTRTAQDAARLVEQELKLLKREIELKLERMKATVAIGAVGAIGAVLTLLTATVTAILGLSIVLPAWAAALIITGLWAVVSAVGLGWTRKRFDEHTPHPEMAERSVRRDVKALEEAK